MEVARRGLDREARPGGDVTALALVGIAIDDEPENPNRFLDCPALRAAELPRTVRASMYTLCPALASPIATSTISSTSSIPNRLGTTLFSSSGLIRHNCRTPVRSSPLMTCAAWALMISMN